MRLSEVCDTVVLEAAVYVVKRARLLGDAAGWVDRAGREALAPGAGHPERVPGALVRGREGTGVRPGWDRPLGVADGDVPAVDCQEGGRTAEPATVAPGGR